MPGHIICCSGFRLFSQQNKYQQYCVQFDTQCVSYLEINGSILRLCYSVISYAGWVQSGCSCSQCWVTSSAAGEESAQKTLSEFSWIKNPQEAAAQVSWSQKKNPLELTVIIPDSFPQAASLPLIWVQTQSSFLEQRAESVLQLLPEYVFNTSICTFILSDGCV